MKNQLVKRLNQINDLIIKRDCIWTSGINLDFYVDMKRAYGKRDCLNLMADLLLDNINKNTSCVAGMGNGGIPLATAVALKHNLNLSLIRSEPKKWGLNKLIDGYIPKKRENVSIVDYVFTTWKSLKEIKRILNQTEANIVGYHVVLKRLEIEPDFPLNYILTSDDLI